MNSMKDLTSVFRLVFRNDRLTIGPQTTPNDIEGWDSMAHVNLIAAVEIRFKIKFTSKELASIRTVGDLAKLIDGKLP